MASAPVAIDPIFLEFYNYLGGEKALGPAASAAISVDGTVFQYTQGGILLYDPQAQASQRFQLAPLPDSGDATVDPPLPPPTRVPPSPTAEPVPSQRSIEVWATYPVLVPGQSQEILVKVFENETPLSSVAVELTLTLPDGSTQEVPTEPTGQDGQTRVMIDPVSTQKAGRIPYRVCVGAEDQRMFCVQKTFLIWIPETGETPVLQASGQKIMIPLIFQQGLSPEG